MWQSFFFVEVPVTDEAVMREQEDDTPEAKEYVDQFSDPKWLELKKLLLPAIGTVTAIPPPKGTPGKPQTQGYQSWKTPHGTIYVETTKTTPMKLTLNFGFANSIYAKQEKVKQLQDFFDRMHVRDTSEEWNGTDVQAGATIAMDNIPAAAKIINDAVKILSSDQLAAESRIRLKDLVMEITLANIEPYTNTINWEDSNMGYEFQFRDDAGNDISVFMADTAAAYGDEADDDDEEPIYEVSFFVKNPKSGGVYSATQQKQSTTANYLRIMATVGAAIMDFLKRYRPYFVEFIGADSDPKKAAQKTRLYTQFARDNSGKLNALGYRFVSTHMVTGLDRID